MRHGLSQFVGSQVGRSTGIVIVDIRHHLPGINRRRSGTQAQVSWEQGGIQTFGYLHRRSLKEADAGVHSLMYYNNLIIL